MKVTLAGTGGMIPLPYRWLVSCHIHHNGKYFLIDCGEGTQIALEEAGINPGRIDVLMITHFHADHIMGLPGLLMAMANKGKKSKLTLIGPKQLHAVASALCVVCPPMPYDIEVIEMEGGESFILDEVTIESMALSHRIACLGYRLTVNKKPVFSPEKAQSLAVPVKYYKTLHAGKSVRLPNGKLIEPEMVIEKKREPIRLCYCTDTLPIPEIAEFAKDADLFICEGMYANEEMAEKMEEKHHTLIREAAALANQAHAKELWLTHFSPAFKHPEESEEYARSLFPDAKIGFDGMTKEIK
ncbi:MAG: ribonuclease Z [Clostridiales bacterium]|nr:ribonuclease Z [Clostridiales bacterium]